MGRVTVQWRAPDWLRRPAESVGLGMIYLRATKLSLQGPVYDDRVAEHLVKLRRLESLTLSDTKLSDAAIARLRRALPHCRIERMEAQGVGSLFRPDPFFIGLQRGPK